MIDKSDASDQASFEHSAGMQVAASSPKVLHRHNNLDALRLCGALAVIVGHGYALLGRSNSTPLIAGMPVHAMGVAVFFIISGYLITKSWNRSRSIAEYGAARCLRIFPALIVTVLLCIFVLGPLVTRLSIGDYFRSPATWDYLWNIPLSPRFALPGVFESNPYPVAVNGSLWTLPVEFACYIIVPIAFVVGRKSGLIAAAAFGIGAAFIDIFATDPLLFYGTSIRQSAHLWVFFALGMILAVLNRPGFFRLDLAIVLLAMLLVMCAASPSHAQVFHWLLLPYIVLAFGLSETPVLRQASRFGDFSYGLYIYAFPVQQLVAQWKPEISMAANLVLVTALTLILAIGSWKLIEAPALHVKARVGLRLRARATAPVATTQ